MIFFLACLPSTPTVYPGSLVLFDDQAVADLCTERSTLTITGDLEIGTAVTDLAPLSCLQRIDGYLHIEATPLTTLAGLQNLSSIGDYLYVGYNKDLLDLSGLNGLTVVEGSIDIKGLPLLADLSGLENLRKVGRIIDIRGNTGMSSFHGLEGLTEVGVGFRIEYNDLLQDLSAISNIDVLRGDFVLMGSPELHSLEGVTVERLGGDFSISRTGLQNLEGLQQLQVVRGSWIVVDNPQLLSMEDAGVTQILGDVRITGNPLLEGAETWVEGVEVGGSVSITP